MPRSSLADGDVSIATAKRGRMLGASGFPEAGAWLKPGTSRESTAG